MGNTPRPANSTSVIYLSFPFGPYFRFPRERVASVLATDIVAALPHDEAQEVGA